MNKQAKLEATAIVAPVIRANAKANSKRKVTTYDQATGKTVRETTVLVLQESLLAKAEILGVDTKQELKRAEGGGCRKCGELRKSKFSNGHAAWCVSCVAYASKCNCGNLVSKTTRRYTLRGMGVPICNTCAKKNSGKTNSKPRLYCCECAAILPRGASSSRAIEARCGKPPMCIGCSRNAVARLSRKLKRKSISGYRGVTPINDKWRGVIMHRGQHIRLSIRTLKEDAAYDYDMAVCDMLGINAICNFGEAMYI